jgi:hypothetical protein
MWQFRVIHFLDSASAAPHIVSPFQRHSSQIAESCHEKIDQVWDVFGSSIVVIEDDEVVFKFDVQGDGSITGTGRDGAKLTFTRRTEPAANR